MVSKETTIVVCGNCSKAVGSGNISNSSMVQDFI